MDWRFVKPKNLRPTLAERRKHWMTRPDQCKFLNPASKSRPDCVVAVSAPDQLGWPALVHLNDTFELGRVQPS